MDEYPFRNYVWGEDREWEFLRRKKEYRKDFEGFIKDLPIKKYSSTTFLNLPHHATIISNDNEFINLVSSKHINNGTSDYIRSFKELKDKWQLHNVVINPDISYESLLNMCQGICDREGRPLEYPNIFISGHGKVMQLNVAMRPDYINLAIPRDPRNKKLLMKAILQLFNDSHSGRLHNKYYQDLMVYDFRKEGKTYFEIAATVYKKNIYKSIQTAKKAYERTSREIDGCVDALAQVDDASNTVAYTCEICPDANKCEEVCPEIEKQLSKFYVKQQHCLPEVAVGTIPIESTDESTDES